MTERSYVLVVRVWSEPDGCLTARVLGQLDPGAEPEFDRAAAGRDGLAAIVDEWVTLVTRP